MAAQRPAFPSASLGNQAELDEFVNTLMGCNLRFAKTAPNKSWRVLLLVVMVPFPQWSLVMLV